MEVTRTFDLLRKYKEEFPQKDDALAGKVDGKWVKHSSMDYIEKSNLISYGLMAMGLKKGDKIATISNNRPEWNFVDMGMAQIGVIHVPIFTTLGADGYDQIFKSAEPRLVFVSDDSLYRKISPLVQQNDFIDELFTFDRMDGAAYWEKVLELGQEKKADYEAEVEKIKDGISPDECVTLIYTSGTTGNSKGVMLSHTNLVSTSKAAAGVFNLRPDQRYLSILPICHVGERMGCYQTQHSGCSIYYAENLGTIANDLQDVKPHGFGAVPRILEKVYDKIVMKGEALTGVKRKLFFWALNLGLNYKLGGKNGPWYGLQLWLANKIIFSKWREAMGGNVQSIGIGGAALQPRLERVFWAAGIKLLNMYGLTETAPIITINRATKPKLKLGTVGAVVDGVEVKIAEDGEILCKGPNVMMGYYNNEKATNDVLKDGWFHTGDIGELDPDGFLRITDRKKEIFKLSNGIYVAPQSIENKFKESVFIDQLFVIGEGEKFTSALISPSFDELNRWARKNKVWASSKEELVQMPEVIALYSAIAKDYNAALGKDEKVKRMRIVADEWTPDSGELSPTLKLKRKVMFEKYQHIINEIYRHNEEPAGVK